VEEYLRTGVLPTDGLVRQHGAEDGSDRNEWQAPPGPDVIPDVPGARSVYRHVEYALDWRAVRGEDAPAGVPCGSIDLLWEEAEGGWTVVLVHADGAVPDDPWCGRKPGLVLAAVAAQRRFGDWPRRVILHRTAGRPSSLPGPLDAHRTTLDAVDAAL